MIHLQKASAAVQQALARVDRIGDLLQAALDDDAKYPQLKLPKMQRDRIVQALDLIGRK